MKKNYLFILIATLMLGFNASAQLPKGSVAPNFIVRDVVNNQPIDLYAILNSGKTVFMDVSAAWCGPCWNYHQEGHLESLWRKHGPAGGNGVNANTTDDVYVIWVEGESGNTRAQLYGTSVGTGATFSQGNWVNGTLFPMVDTLETWFNTNYNIGYFPTIYRICRDRLIEEVGQIDSNALYASIAPCPTTAPSSSVDAKMATASYTSAYFCGTPVAADVVFQNYSTTPLTSANIEVYQGANLLATAPWSGNLATYQTDTLKIPSISGVSATTFPTTLDFKVVATGDAVNSNDLLTNNSVIAYASTNSSNLPINETYESYAASSNGQLNYIYDADLFFYDGVNNTTKIMGANGSNTKCIVLPYPSMANSTTESIIAGNYNTTTTATYLNLTFDVAHSFAGTETDEFEALVSTNCGASWTSVLKLTGKTGANSFSTCPDNANAANNPLIPTSASQWSKKGADLSNYKNNNNLLVKFTAIMGTGQSDYGFLDNVKLEASSTGLGVDNVSAANFVNIFPNPATSNSTLQVNLGANSTVSYEIVDVLGKVVSAEKLGNLVSGAYNFNLNLNELNSGVYMVNVNVNGNTSFVKLNVVK